ncbi:MAG: hypothetical protein VB144_11705 [Clostridia bacterium]|nr:hypothetical protein [Clostridia bacterium]
MAGYTYRPLADVWILARTKQHYYGAYPGGFLWRAKALLPGEMCHMCSGTVRGDYTVDLNPAMEPSLVADARDTGLPAESFEAVLIDPPYTPEDATQYGYEYPEPKDLLREAWRLIKPGGRVGILHYIVPRPPAKDARLLALVSVVVGFGNRVRVFTVFEKPKTVDVEAA